MECVPIDPRAGECSQRRGMPVASARPLIDVYVNYGSVSPFPRTWSRCWIYRFRIGISVAEVKATRSSSLKTFQCDVARIHRDFMLHHEALPDTSRQNCASPRQRVVSAFALPQRCVQGGFRGDPTHPHQDTRCPGELTGRQRRQSQRHRTILLVVDSRRAEYEVRSLAQKAGATEGCVGELLELGMIFVPPPPDDLTKTMPIASPFAPR